MSLTEEERRAIVQYRIEKAKASLNDAIDVSAIGKWSLAANRLYYALYYAATALLINDGHITRTHSGMISLVSFHYVQNGKLSKDEGKLLKRIFDLRQESDYDDFIDADETDITTYLPMVSTLVDRLISMIK